MKKGHLNKIQIFKISTALIMFIFLSATLFTFYFEPQGISGKAGVYKAALRKTFSKIASPLCVPKSCKSLGVSCGQASDGCGKIIDCGACLKGLTCWQGRCRPPGVCALDINCGLNEPASAPYCAGQDIYQDIRYYQCSPSSGMAYYNLPGSVCLNKSKRAHLYTCPSNTSCRSGLCYKPCAQDSDCSRMGERIGYYTLPCQQDGFCPAQIAEDLTGYAFCVDSDRTLYPFDIKDPSFLTPGYIMCLHPDKYRPVEYLFDSLHPINSPSGVLREWYYPWQNNQISHDDINCSRIMPGFIGNNFRTGFVNQYQPYTVNVGFCG